MIVGVHIEKEVSWRGAAERFENVYHYDTPVINTDSGWDSLIDAIVAIEKPLFAIDVQFKQARIHGPTNQTKADDVMIRIKDLAGAGTGASANTMPKELAVVAQLYMGRSPRGFKTFLRKYWHVCGLVQTTGGGLFGNTSMAAADITQYQNALNNLKTVTVGAGANDLCKKNGQHVPLGTNAQVLPILHTRQFRR